VSLSLLPGSPRVVIAIRNQPARKRRLFASRMFVSQPPAESRRYTGDESADE
jgi:hypothetical protein